MLCVAVACAVSSKLRAERAPQDDRGLIPLALRPSSPRDFTSQSLPRSATIHDLQVAIDDTFDTLDTLVDDIVHSEETIP